MRFATHKIYTLVQESNILFLQRPQVIVKVSRESMSSSLVVWLDRITKVLVWRRAGNKVLEVIMRERGNTVYFLFLIIWSCRP